MRYLIGGLLAMLVVMAVVSRHLPGAATATGPRARDSNLPALPIVSANTPAADIDPEVKIVLPPPSTDGTADAGVGEVAAMTPPSADGAGPALAPVPEATSQAVPAVAPVHTAAPNPVAGAPVTPTMPMAGQPMLDPRPALDPTPMADRVK